MEVTAVDFNAEEYWREKMKFNSIMGFTNTIKI
jgi:hypothetical protein